jgi:lipoprotein-releasing system permease protein
MVRGTSGNLEKVGSSQLRMHFIGKESNEDPMVSKYALNEEGTQYEFRYPINPKESAVYRVDVEPMKGTSNAYLSGYEIRVNHWNALEKTKALLKEKIERIPDEHGQLTKVVSIFDLEQDLFNWLSILDLNVIIIITLMLIIGIINMGSAMLVMIILRSNFIGMMKAMGASHRTLRNIFLMQAAYLIGKGMLFGNAIGLSLYFIQKTTKVFSLNPEVYYLDAIPVELTLTHFVLLNLGTFIICILALLIPSMVIAKMSPIKTIKFD